MIVTSSELQNNFEKYIELASSQEIVITKNGLPIARLLGMKETVSFLSDRLVGIIPHEVNEISAKEERLSLTSKASNRRASSPRFQRV